MTDLEPLKLTEVVTTDVGSPRNDGTRRSGLYVVPIQLDRPVTGAESRLLAEVWDAPRRSPACIVAASSEPRETA